MVWHEYEQAVAAAEVDSVIPVTTPRIYVIQPANLTDQATTIITSLDSISVKEWSAAERADAAWAPWFDYFEQQRLPVDRTIKVAMFHDKCYCLTGTLGQLPKQLYVDVCCGCVVRSG
jgi:hypothetical protein